MHEFFFALFETFFRAQDWEVANSDETFVADHLTECFMIGVLLGMPVHKWESKLTLGESKLTLEELTDLGDHYLTAALNTPSLFVFPRRLPEPAFTRVLVWASDSYAVWRDPLLPDAPDRRIATEDARWILAWSAVLACAVHALEDGSGVRGFAASCRVCMLAALLQHALRTGNRQLYGVLLEHQEALPLGEFLRGPLGEILFGGVLWRRKVLGRVRKP